MDKDISELGNNTRIVFYSPMWKFSKLTTLGILRRFCRIWGGYIIQDSDIGRIYNVVVGNVAVGWFTK